MLRRPLPEPDPVRPFHRNSTLEDLETTKVGRMLGAVVEREGLKRAAQEFPDPDDATLQMVRSALKEGPARSLALMSGGMVRLEQIDTLLDLLNGQWSSAGQRLRRAVQRRS